MCSIDNCSKPKHSAGFCVSHYNAYKRYGDPLVVKRLAKIPEGSLCVAEGCSRPVKSRNYCVKHYGRFKRHGHVEETKPMPKYEDMSCIVIEDSQPCKNKRSSNGYCGTHYKRWKKYGDPLVGKRVYTGAAKYRFKVAKDHPNARSDGQIMEHRLVMSNHIGRALLPYENVHHINGDRYDNRIENLELWSHSQPRGQRIEDKVKWAIELLQTYAPENLKDK